MSPIPRIISAIPISLSCGKSLPKAKMLLRNFCIVCVVSGRLLKFPEIVPVVFHLPVGGLWDPKPTFPQESSTAGEHVLTNSLCVYLSSNMPAITENVIFDTLAREWRCKWSPDEEKASLSAAQNALAEILPKLKAIDGCKVQRCVCGGCLDFKVIISLPADKFNKLEEANLEEGFLAALRAVPGLTDVETQTYTLMPL